MNVVLRVSALSLALATLAGNALAADGGSGEISLRKSTWAVADTVAFVEDGELRVAVSDVPFDRDAMRKDGKLNVFDVLRHSGQTVTLSIGANGPSGCYDFYVRAGDTQYSGSSCDGELDKAFSGLGNDGTRARGAVDWRKDDEKIVVNWDVPILSLGDASASDSSAGAAPAGTALPADGGEPGKAVLAHFAALQKGDWKAFKALAHPERQALMAESEKAGEHLEMFELLRSFAAQDVRITGGRVDADTAHVDFTGSSDGQPVRGTAEVQKQDGRWYFAGSELKNGD